MPVNSKSWALARARALCGHLFVEVAFDKR